MKGKTKKWAILSLSLTMGLCCAFAVAGLAPNLPAMAEETNNEDTEPVAVSVAKVGEKVYATVDEAIVAWTNTNNSTLTLLSDVTLSDVIKLKSTENHTLDLGTYTMTAASGKHAIEITCEGRSSASYALTVNANADNPGGITATGKACIYYKKSGSTKDRPIILINNGVFNGSYSINSISNGNTNCPQIWIYGGTFNGNVNLTKNMLRVFGGTFNGWINCTGDTSAYREFSGGKFKNWQFMTADADSKFWVGTSKANYDVGCYVDENGYLVVGGPIITDFGDEFKIKTTYSSWSGYLEYSSANENGLYYKSVEKALNKNNVKLLMDEIDLTEITAKLNGSVSLGADDTLKVKFDNAEYLPTFKTSVRNSKVVYVDSAKDENGVVTRTYTVVEDIVLAQVNETYCKTALEFVNAIEENATITLFEDIDITPNADETQAVLLATTEKYTTLPDVLELPNGVTIDGQGHTIEGTVYTNSELTINSTVNFTTLYIGASSTINGANEALTATTKYEMSRFNFSVTADKTALKATESLNVTVSIDKAYYAAEYTFTYDTATFACAADTNDDGVIFVSNLYQGGAGDLATYTLVAKNDIQSVYEGEVFGVTGNVVEFKEQLLNGIETEVVGDVETVKVSLNYTAGIKADYVQGYTLVLAQGDDAGYAYNGVKMFYVEAYDAYAILVKGAVTEAMIDVALSKTTDCETIRQSYNVNAEYVKDGVIDIKDATMTYACTIVDFDVAEYMELYLRADVNGDCKVNIVDINAIVKNYTK